MKFSVAHAIDECPIEGCTKLRKTRRVCVMHYTRMRRHGSHDKPVARRNFNPTLAELKSYPCTDCGGTFPPECMDFDHTGNKLNNIGRLNGSPNSKGVSKRVLNEIAKCELVCANCHRIRTRIRKLT